MADKHRPRRGSMGFSPRKRANRPYGTVTAWPDTNAQGIRVQGFAGWKAGMTHVLVKNTNPTSTSAGQEVRKAVTVVETPPMRILGVRGYSMDPYGLRTAGEVWCEPDDLPPGIVPRLANATRGERDASEGRKPAKRGGRIPSRSTGFNQTAYDALTSADLIEVRIIAATQPNLVSGSPSKTSEIMELNLVGGTPVEKLEWAKERLGAEITIEDVWEDGQEIDVIGITKGKGFQGSVKRWGVKLLSHKNSKKRRQAGNLGDFGTGYVRSTVPQAGQMGYHQRTELNKRLLRISTPLTNEITPAGGFLNYGEVKNAYVLVQGSLPGPAKRLLRLRDPIRPRKNSHPIDLTYVSTASKQGV
ncbi:MAG: 50S ribosomal protein L3 [Euryarchaeota archaeon]|nr:50S ribosomal protein L3 [Euryarchaeota archaeon]